MLSRNFTTWEMVPLVHYEQWFAAMEPASLSPTNMEAVWKWGRRRKQVMCCRLLELATSLDPSSKIGVDKCLDTIVDDLCKANEQNGRILRDVTFPIDWQKVGAYGVPVDTTS